MGEVEIKEVVRIPTGWEPIDQHLVSSVTPPTAAYLKHRSQSSEPRPVQVRPPWP